jgi:hypothetical protein
VVSIVAAAGIAALAGCGGPSVCAGGQEVSVDPSVYAPLLGTRMMAVRWLGGCDISGANLANPGPPLPFTGDDELTLTIAYGGGPFMVPPVYMSEEEPCATPMSPQAPATVTLQTASGRLAGTIAGAIVAGPGGPSFVIQSTRVTGDALTALGPLGAFYAKEGAVVDFTGGSSGTDFWLDALAGPFTDTQHVLWTPLSTGTQCDCAPQCASNMCVALPNVNLAHCQ